MNDRIRKYDDWNIVRPTSAAPVNPPVNLEPIEEIQETLATPPNTEQVQPVSVLEPGEPILNPFADVGSTNTASTAPVSFEAESPAFATDAVENFAPDIDPETGLPIPDYMKPFLSRE